MVLSVQVLPVELKVPFIVTFKSVWVVVSKELLNEPQLSHWEVPAAYPVPCVKVSE